MKYPADYIHKIAYIQANLIFLVINLYKKVWRCFGTSGSNLKADTQPFITVVYLLLKCIGGLSQNDTAIKLTRCAG